MTAAASTTEPTAAPPAAVPPRARSLRPDVQGLRAVAVVAVILDHAVGSPSGGFGGVDVFFVISGFLITGLLLREHDRTGTISFRGFYVRRVKRILPAALLVLVVTVCATWLLTNTSTFDTVLGDAVWAALFSANWRMIAVGTDYFAASAPSPLQHFWSLGVEEQFYFVWPWLMLLLLTVVGRRAGTQRARAVVVAVLALLTTGSFAWAMVETAANPAAAYFSTASRAWELGVGALIAVAAGRLRLVPDRWRPAAAWLGLVTIGAGIVLVDDSLPFPAPWAALPVAGAALVIAAGTGGEHRFLLPLTNPVLRWLGDLSYSLYLWHLPVVVLLLVVFPSRGPVYLAIALGGTLVLAALSYHLVEDPIRRSALLSGGGAARSRRARRAVRLGGYPRWQWGLMGAFLTVAAVALSASLVQPVGGSANAAVEDVAAPSEAPAAGAQGVLTADIGSALRATSWPQLRPALDTVLAGAQVPLDIEVCGSSTPPPLARCTWGSRSAKTTIAIVGDSTSLAYAATFKALAAADKDVRVSALGMFGCPFIDVPTYTNDPQLRHACPTRIQQEVARIKSMRPDLVIVTNTYQVVEHADGRTPVTDAEWTAGLERLLGAFRGDAGAVAVVAPPPAQKDPHRCYSRFSSPSDCVTRVGGVWQQRADAERAAATQGFASWIDSRPWFCVQDRCPEFVGTVPVKVDATHMTPAYGAFIEPVVAEALRRERLL